MQLLDVSLDLVHLGLEHLLARHLADGVEFTMVALLLIVAHEFFPLFLEGCDQLLTLFLGHERPLSVHGGLILNLHLTNEIVLVLDLLLDLGHVLGHFAVSLLLQKVLLLRSGQFRGWQKVMSVSRAVLTCEDVLDGVGNDEVFVGDETLDWLLVTLRHGRFGNTRTLEFAHYMMMAEKD